MSYLLTAAAVRQIYTIKQKNYRRAQRDGPASDLWGDVALAPRDGSRTWVASEDAARRGQSCAALSKI